MRAARWRMAAEIFAGMGFKFVGTNWCVLSIRQILPHPQSLSRWEREAAYDAARNLDARPAADAATIFVKRRTVLPLPAGEGRGEGERLREMFGAVLCKRLEAMSARRPRRTKII